MVFVGYKKCSTSNRAELWLKKRNIDYCFSSIKEENPTANELKTWHKKSGLPLKRFFNTSGILYKELNLKEKLKTMSEEEQINLLSSNGMLVKRPILISDSFVLVGFKENEWENKLL